MEEKKRRIRGQSALGNFEQSKQVASEEEERRTEADRQKTERLRALRQAQEPPARK
ncbi:hypothetical protein [Pararhizobium arenae]|uniref:hypothetical protein n=1 Tax=Pararhizobium arenae TaxID=1856850 RepID=UPI000AD27D60|nr:hypothetical protein [Pararhizobium arenae]